MRKAYSWLAAHPFIRANLIYFVGSVATAILNYIYYPVLGRMLSVSAFGDTQLLITIFMQLAIFYGALGMVVTNITANAEDEVQRNRMVQDLTKLALCIMAIVTCFAIILSVPIIRFLNLGDGRAYFALVCSLVMTVPLTFGLAFLQGRRRFGELSLISMMSSSLKLMASVCLVLLGLSAFGAVGGVLVAQLITFYVVMWRIRQAGYRRTKSAPAESGLNRIKPELRYAGLTLTVSFSVTFLYSADIVVVKHYFGAEEAGLYAGVATIARMIFFLATPVSTVMFSAIKRTANHRDNMRIVLSSLSAVGLLTIGALGLFSLAPQRIVQLLLGAEYSSLAHLLPQLSLAVCLIAIANTILLYHLALRRVAVGGIAFLSAILTLTLLILRHDSLSQVVQDMVAGGLGALCLLGLWAVRNQLFARHKRSGV